MMVPGLRLLAGRLDAQHGNGNRVSGVSLAARVALVAACSSIVVLGCLIGGVRARLRDATRRLVAVW